MEGTRDVFVCPLCGRLKDSVDPDGHVPARRFCDPLDDHRGRRVLMRRYLVALAPDPPELLSR